MQAIEARNESFKAIQEELPGKRAEVFECIKRFQPISNEEIADRLGWKVQSVCGRVLELRGWLYDNDLKRSVLHEDRVFVEFDSYVIKDKPKSGSRWRITNKAVQTNLNFN